MITCTDKKIIIDDQKICGPLEELQGFDEQVARNNTLASRILNAHDTDSGHGDTMRIRFDALASHDITYVGIIQTARASGLKKFPVPYALTNCHNSLCAVGGTINEDDHVFGLSAAKKYGGIFVPPHLAVIHQYVREMMTKCGSMILGSDSHTRYGALGVMGIGEGGPELVKQLLGKTYDVPKPKVVAIWLEGAPRPGVGPQDVALAIIRDVFKSGFVKNKVMEFMGPGVANLSVEYRCGIDVMTTETTCLSSIWTTDERVRQYFALHGREDAYTQLKLEGPACYDGLIRIDLDRIEPMIALPFHPSNAYPISELIRHGADILAATQEEAERQFGNAAKALNLPGKFHDGGIWVDQGIIAGCAGGNYENLVEAAAILDGKTTGDTAFSLSVYPASAPQGLALTQNGAAASLMAAGVVIKNAFCGPCFGAGDTPANGALSIRHSTRNFPNREGSKPGAGQLSAVALMDARSIAATAANGGRLTSACDLDWGKLQNSNLPYSFEPRIYALRVYNGYGKEQPDQELVLGPNIADWPAMSALPEHLILKIASVIKDPVTTTDELIPSGETSSLRSNPLKLSEFTLSRKDPEYVARAKAFQKFEKERIQGTRSTELQSCIDGLREVLGQCDIQLCNDTSDLQHIGFGTTIFAMKPGDGSAREQAASCQKVLGGWANVAVEYATKRYRSNLINWGMLPFQVKPEQTDAFVVDGYLVVPNIRSAVSNKSAIIKAYLISDTKKSLQEIELSLSALTDDERQIILDGCLINFYSGKA